MKRFWITTLIVASIIIGAGFWAMGVHASDDDQYICGKTFMYFQNEITYLLKFTSSNSAIPCTTGYATLFWQDKASSYNFAVDSRYVVTIDGVGRLFADGAELFWLDTATIIFDEF